MVEPLSAVIGQERAIALLRRYIGAGAVPQGLLFSGAEGVGKEKAARAFAAALLCRKPGKDGACGSCHDCRLLASGAHPNFLFIAPETQFLRIDEIRALREELSLKAFSDRPRVAILCPADRMTPQAANALLKTLEEPPAGAHLILVAHRTSVLMPTIVSRCQRVPFFPLSADAVAEILSRHPDVGGEHPRPVIAAGRQGLRGKPGPCPLAPARARGGAGDVARAPHPALPGGGGETRGELEGGGGSYDRWARTGATASSGSQRRSETMSGAASTRVSPGR